MKKQLLCISIFIMLVGCSKNLTPKGTCKELYEKNITSETTILPTSAERIDKPMITIDRNRILHTLQLLSLTPRPFGSDGEKRTIEYLNNELISYGYITEHQQFSIYQNKNNNLSLALREENKEKVLGYGINLIGTLLSKEDTDKYLIISAHHDTIKNSVGLIDNATGVSIVLEVARLLQDSDVPFNIKFIFFGAEEEGCIGSREYLSRLTDNEKDQIIGCINIDMVGEKSGKALSIGTRYSRANALSISLNEYLEEEGMKPSFYGLSDDYFMFKNNIPALSINNKTDQSLERLSYAEQMENVDVQILIDTIEMVVGFILDFDLQKYNQDNDLAMLEDSNINLNNSRFNIKEATIPNYNIKDIRLSLIQKGASSETIATYINDNGDMYYIIQVPDEYFNQENLNTMKLIGNSEDIDLYINEDKESSLKAIYKETYGFYYGKVIGNLTEEEIILIFK